MGEVRVGLDASMIVLSLLEVSFVLEELGQKHDVSRMAVKSTDNLESRATGQ